MEKGNAEAFNNLAGDYTQGILGLPRDRAKANELYLKAGELGCATGYYNLGNSYYAGRGVEVDKKKAMHYYELSSMKGNVKAMYNLGCSEIQAGNYQRAFKHLIIAARAGHATALENVKIGFMNGHITKEEYANALREYQKSQDEMKSEARDIALITHNQRIGG